MCVAPLRVNHVQGVGHRRAAEQTTMSRLSLLLAPRLQVTAFTDAEERAVGKDGLVPFLLEAKLKAS